MRNTNDLQAKKSLVTQLQRLFGRKKIYTGRGVLEAQAQQKIDFATKERVNNG